MADTRQLKLAADDDQHLVYGEVYAPDRPDAHNEFMRAEEIQKMAHDFLRNNRCGQIDLMHDNQIIANCSVVESYIAQKGDPMFIPGAWVVGVHVPDEKVWQQIKKGDINGFSMEALVRRHDVNAQVEFPPVVKGLTSKSEDHTHEFFVTYDEDGLFRGGMTSMVQGHTHQIIAGTHTEVTKGHSHRFSSVDNARIL